jgi:hypothetical protein
MKITIGQTGKTYIAQGDKVKVIHNHDSIIYIAGEYYKNVKTNEWISEDEYYDSLCLKFEKDESNKYY